MRQKSIPMVNNSSEEITFLKDKNDKLIKELVEYKNVRRQLQQDMDYLVKEKFLADQKNHHLEENFSVLNSRTRSCLDKIVECSTDLVEILRLLSSVSKTRESNDGINLETANITLTNKINEISKNSDEQDSWGDPQKENLIPHESSFLSRGGKTVLPENNHGMEHANMEMEMQEADNTELQNNLTSAGKVLSIIFEDSEASSCGYEGAQKQDSFTLEDASSMTYCDQVPAYPTNVNVRRGECNFDNLNMSTYVEPSSILENSKWNPDNTMVTPKRSSNRKSIGSPRPSLEGSTRITPHRFSSRKSLELPVALSGDEKQKPSLPNENSPLSSMEKVVSRRLKNRKPSELPVAISNDGKQNTALPNESSHLSSSEKVVTRRLKDRKSIVNPRPSLEGSTRITPHRFSTRKSLELPVALSGERKQKPSLPSENSPLSSSERVVSRRLNNRKPSELPVAISDDEKQKPSLPKESSPLSSSEKVVSRRVKKVHTRSSFLERTIKTHDLSNMVDIIKNTSTPIQKTITAQSSRINTRNFRDDDGKSECSSKETEINTYAEDDSSVERRGNRSSSQEKSPSPSDNFSICSKGRICSSATIDQEVSQRDERSEGASEERIEFNGNSGDDASSSQASNLHPQENSLRCSKRKRRPAVSLIQKYVECIQRDSQRSGSTETKSRRAVKKVVYKEPSGRKKLRRS